MDPAGDFEAPVCRDLLPGAFPANGPAPMLWLARSPDGRPVGAAALEWARGGFPFVVRVIPEARGRGVARALVEAAAAAAREETSVLRWRTLIDDGSELIAPLERLGFSPARTFLRFEADRQGIATIHAGLRAIQSHRGPAGVEVQPLDAVPRQAVADLLAATFGLSSPSMSRRLAPGESGSYDPSFSIVALAQGRVIGALLGASAEPDAIEIDMYAVAPDRRRTMASLLLCEAMAERCLEAGVRRIHFSCEPHVRDTVNLARRMNAVPLPARRMFARSLTA